MPHFRTRFMENILSQDLSFSPSVAIFGMRQVGKSTLLKRLAARYYTFDDDAFVGEFQRNYQAILVTPPFPIALDEIQKYPPAFHALKLAIDNHKVPGRFLLSGSVRFASRLGVRESLTGRITMMDLLPMTLAECHNRSLSVFISTTLQNGRWNQLSVRLQKKAWANETMIWRYFLHGGLPGICFTRNNILRHRYFTAHLDTLLSRDIQLIRKTNLPVPILLQLLKEIAAQQGLPMNATLLARKAHTSVTTVMHILRAFEGLFLIRAYDGTYFIEDLGVSNFLYRSDETFTRQNMIQILFQELRAQISYSATFSASMAPYSTRGGVDVPFVITIGKHTLAIGVDDGQTPTEKSLKSLTWFKKKHKLANILLLCRCEKAFTTISGVPCLPWTWVF